MERRQIIPVVERGETEFPLELLLTGQELDIYEDVRAQQFFRVSSRENSLTFFAGNHVGFIPLNEDIALLVEPKIARENRENWLHIIGKARGYLTELHHLRTYSRSISSYMPVIEFLARALVHQLLPMKQRGLHRTYQRRQEVTCYPRGRFLFGESMQWAWGRGHQRSLAVEYYVLSKDVPHNRLLRYSLDVAIRYIEALTDLDQVEGGARLRASMRDVEDVFGAVPLDSSLSYLPLVRESLRSGSIPHERGYYRDACKTAMMLVDHKGVDPLFLGERETLSFVVNMETVFQDYCFHVLNDAKAKLGWLQVLKEGGGATRPFFEEPRNDERDATPDIVIQDEGEIEYPLEVKYKDKPNRRDINQAVTYALAYGVDRAVLICFTNDPGTHPRRYFHGSVGNQVDLWTCRICPTNSDIEEEEVLFVDTIGDILAGGA